MSLVISVIAGILPMLIYPLFVYWLDRYEKEPLTLLLAVFIWGFVPAALLSIISQIILSVPFYLVDETGATASLAGAVILAPITEEIFKGAAVALVYVLWRREFDGIFDGIIYGCLVGFGFAAIENILYFATAGEDLVLLIFMRAFLFGLNHAFYTSFIGIGFGVARHASQVWVRIAAPVLGLIAAMFFHFVHNLTVSLAGTAPVLLCLNFISNYGGILTVLVVIVLAIRRERVWITEQLKEEVSKGGLQAEHYAVLSNPIRRYVARISSLLVGGPVLWWKVGQFYGASTELAYKKHARSKRNDQGATQPEIDALRSKVTILAAELGPRVT